jgi:Protein of unknown function (DUF2970)
VLYAAKPTILPLLTANQTMSQQKSSIKLFFSAILVVLCAFIGIRKNKYLELAPDIKPIHYITAGLFALFCFVMILRTVVKLVIRASAGG